MPQAPLPTPPESGEQVFFRRLATATCGLLVLLLLIYFLREFKAILQPLFVAVFLSYVLLPAHRWIVQRGVSPMLAYVVLLALLVGSLVGLGTLVYGNVLQLVEKLPFYEERLEKLLNELLERLSFSAEERNDLIHGWLRGGPSTAEETAAEIRGWMGTFLNFFSALAITCVYLVFVVVERGHFSRRVLTALTPTNAERVLAVAANINDAISEYLAVKTFISFLGGVFTMVILGAFSIDFFVTWGILAFLLNFIPYLGSLAATVLPILLALLQLGWWQAAVIGLLLIAMQQTLGVVVEPRMAGQRLGVSPLLILLSLSFWGVVWGIVGMILAVPLLVSVKIILENIDQTRPLAALMANIDTPEESA